MSGFPIGMFPIVPFENFAYVSKDITPQLINFITDSLWDQTRGVGVKEAFCFVCKVELTAAFVGVKHVVLELVPSIDIAAGKADLAGQNTGH